MQTMTPLAAHEEIAKAAKAPLVEHRQIAAMKVGQFARQGDVYIERIASVNADWKVSADRQLAPGTSPGSRHVVTAGPVLRVSPTVNPRETSKRGVRLLGPQIHAEHGFTVTHPEHAHLCMPPGDYQVSYQLDFNQQRAVRD
jgi:hypothetical protein